MEIFILLLTIILLIIIFTLLRKKRRLKIIFILIIIAAGGITMILKNLYDGEIRGEELISSFLSGNNLESEQLKPIETPETEPPVWNTYNSEISEFRFGENSFSIKAAGESIWGKESTGPMIFRNAEGNFFLSTLVRTRPYSDTLNFSEDRAWQFGGIMLRNPDSLSGENYIYIAVGKRYNDLRLEVKSTTEGKSTSKTFKWPSGDAELMIQREAVVFGLYARPFGTKGEWTRVQTYYRPDLPNTLQAGIIIYSFSYGKKLNDFIAYFDDVNIRRENE
jgi:hypothetical protein